MASKKGWTQFLTIYVCLAREILELLLIESILSENRSEIKAETAAQIIH